MAIDKELLDQLLDGRDPQELFARDGLIDELKKALSERMLAAELDDHLESEAEAGVADQRQRRFGGGVRLLQGQPVLGIQQLLALKAQRLQQRRRVMPQIAEDIAQQHHIDAGNTGGEPDPA